MAEEFERQIDPGNEVSKLKPHSTEWVVALLRKWPEATLARGEGGLLVAEIDRLQAEVARLKLPPDHADGL
jgi:hypothetical protein